MTHTITLTPAEEEQVRARAAQQGKDADAFLHDVVLQTLAAPTPDEEDEMPAPGESLYDAWHDKLGRVDGPAEALSENTGERFGNALLEKLQQGHL